MNSKKCPIDIISNNLKISMSHKKNMNKSNFKNNKDILIKKPNKYSFIMEHRKINKIPQRAEIVFADKNDFMDLIKNTLNEINNSDVNSRDVWNKFKEDLIRINDENEGEMLKYNPQELYNLMFNFHCKIENFREEMLKAIDEIDLMGDILKIIQEYEKNKE